MNAASCRGKVGWIWQSTLHVRYRFHIPSVSLHTLQNAQATGRASMSGHVCMETMATAQLVRVTKFAAEQNNLYPEVLAQHETVGPGLFLQIAHMVLDCVEEMDFPNYKRPSVEYFEDTDEEILRLVARWIRFCGTDIAWKDIRTNSILGGSREY